LLLIALRAVPIQGYDNAKIRSSAPGTPILLTHVNNGNIRTTPLDVSTLTIRDVTDVTKKKARRDMNSIPVDVRTSIRVQWLEPNKRELAYYKIRRKTHQASL
jgi:hypothetical protein